MGELLRHLRDDASEFGRRRPAFRGSPLWVESHTAGGASARKSGKETSGKQRGPHGLE